MLVWTRASKHYRDLPDRFQKQICEAFGPALADLPKRLAHHCKIAMLSLSYRHHFGKCSTELSELFPFPLSYVWCTNMLLAALPVIVIACEDYLNATRYKFNNKSSSLICSGQLMKHVTGNASATAPR